MLASTLAQSPFTVAFSDAESPIFAERKEQQSAKNLVGWLAR